MMRKKLIAELEVFQKKYHKDLKKKDGCGSAVHDMLQKMGNHYQKIKEENGIDSEFQIIDKKGIEHRLEDVFKKLKPNCNAKNFKEYLKCENNQSVYSSVKNAARQLKSEENRISEP
jgi:hypothetical protein